MFFWGVNPSLALIHLRYLSDCWFFCILWTVYCFEHFHDVFYCGFVCLKGVTLWCHVLCFFYVFSHNFTFRRVWLRLFAIALPNQSKLPDIKLKSCRVKDDLMDVVWWRLKCSYNLLMEYQSAIAKASKREFDWILLWEQFGPVPFVRYFLSFQTVLRSYLLYNNDLTQKILHLKDLTALTLYWKKIKNKTWDKICKFQKLVICAWQITRTIVKLFYWHFCVRFMYM